jgi:HPr kinase/phosphorylase
VTDSLHAACVALGGVGVLIRGPSGSGKSTLALQLADRPGAAFVADDRVRLSIRAGRVVARAHPGEAERVEVRGQGILRVADLGLATLPEVDVALAVELVDTAPRLPDPPGDVRILGMAVPRLVLDRAVRQAGLSPLLVRAALRERVA